MWFDLLADINDLCFIMSEHSATGFGLCGSKHTVVTKCWGYNRLNFVTWDVWTVCSKHCICVSCTLNKVLLSIPHKQCSPPLCHSPTKVPATHIAWLAAPNFSANPSFPVLIQTQRHLNNMLLYVLCASKCCIV